ncbi:MAG: glycosyltransferase family 4 protein [Desulfotomaculales bacterium]
MSGMVRSAESCKKEAYSLGLAGRIVFTGELLNARDIFTVFDIFVLPSFTEGFPLVLLEALAAGRPVVATRVGGIPEIVTDGHTGFLVKSGDPGELARAIAVLLDNPQIARTIARNGQDYVKSNFSAERMVKSVQEEYVSVLRAKGLFV